MTETEREIERLRAMLDKAIIDTAEDRARLATAAELLGRFVADDSAPENLIDDATAFLANQPAAPSWKCGACRDTGKWSTGIVCPVCQPAAVTPVDETSTVNVQDLDQCPSCNASWQGEPIPETRRQHYGGKTHYRSLIAIYDQDLDCTVAWRCPACSAQWPRDQAVVDLVKDRG